MSSTISEKTLYINSVGINLIEEITMENEKVVITKQAIEVIKKIITNQEKDFVVKSNQLNKLFNKKNLSYGEGLSSGYKQGVIDTLKALGIIALPI